VIALIRWHGSSIFDVNVSIGTFVSVYGEKSSIGMPITEEDILQKGKRSVAAGFSLCSSTMLV